MTEEELMAALVKTHPILAYKPPSPTVAPSPPGVVCGLGLVSCSLCAPSRWPQAQATLIVPAPAPVVDPEEAPLAALRKTSQPVSQPRTVSRQMSSSRKSVCFAEPVSEVSWEK